MIGELRHEQQKHRSLIFFLSNAAGCRLGGQKRKHP